MRQSHFRYVKENPCRLAFPIPLASVMEEGQTPFNLHTSLRGKGAEEHKKHGSWSQWVLTVATNQVLSERGIKSGKQVECRLLDKETATLIASVFAPEMLLMSYLIGYLVTLYLP